MEEDTARETVVFAVIGQIVGDAIRCVWEESVPETTAPRARTLLIVAMIG
jgi:hypothetical protein